MRARVLVVGDLNADLVLRGDVVPRFGQVEQLVDEAALVIGGAAGITAHAFARLGRPVSLVAAVGKDPLGAQLLDDLAAAGVDVAPVHQRCDERTGITVALAHDDDRAMLTYAGALAGLTLDEARAAIEAAPDLAHVHVASSFLLPLLAAELPALFAFAHERGATTSLDTNSDPAARWAGVDDALPHVDVLLPNRVEALAMGGSVKLAAAAGALAARGPLVVVKDGASGALAVVDGAAPLRVEAPRIDPIDTTGAGDTFDAAFLDAWLDHQPLTESLPRAVRAGALAVGGLGGTAAQPTADDLTQGDS